MSRRRRSAGFTLIEMVVATALSSIVLVATFSLVTNLVTAEVNAMRSGTVTAWSLAGINAMSTDIAGAGALMYPAAGVGADYLVLCTNWSRLSGATAQPGAGNTVINYCWDSTDSAPFANTLLRHVQTNAAGAESCTAAPLTPCSSSVYVDAGNPAPIVATGVYKDLSGDPVFLADPATLNAVFLRFSVGNPAANAMSQGGNGGTVTATPVTVPFNTEIFLED